MKKRHAVVLLLLFAVTALCAVLGEGAASRASVLSIDPQDAGSIEAFVGRWLSEEEDDLKYTAATIDVGSCEYRVLAVGEWLEDRPEGMDDTEYSRLQAVWRDVQQTMSQGNVNATLSAN